MRDHRLALHPESSGNLLRTVVHVHDHLSGLLLHPLGEAHHMGSVLHPFVRLLLREPAVVLVVTSHVTVPADLTAYRAPVYAYFSGNGRRGHRLIPLKQHENCVPLLLSQVCVLHVKSGISTAKIQLFGLESAVRCGLFFVPLHCGYLPSVLWGAPGNGSPRTAEDKRLCALFCCLLDTITRFTGNVEILFIGFLHDSVLFPLLFTKIFIDKL